MEFLRLIIAVLIVMFCCVVLYGIMLFVLSFFGFLFDDLTDTNTYFMWSIS